MSLPTCPKCGCQLEVKLIFASGPRSSEQRATEQSDDLGDILEAIDESELDGAAAKFVEETKDRYVKYKDRTKISEKQLKWLKAIAYEGANRKDDWQ